MSDTYLDRLWDAHVIDHLEDGSDLIHVDRHLLHDLHCAIAFSSVEESGREVKHPEMTWAVADHMIATEPGRTGTNVPGAQLLLDRMRKHTDDYGVKMFGIEDANHGIIHIVSAEQGIALPGLTVLACDSHACTVGALGTLTWGTGTSEAEHILATQTIRSTKPKLMRVEFEGSLREGVRAKDLILHLIGHIGGSGGHGYAIEYDGTALRSLSIEDRMTLCNMTMEAGAEIALIRPDEKVYDYLKGRNYAPAGEEWDLAVAHWRALAANCDETGDRVVTLDVSDLGPQITWGTMPSQVISIDGTIPDPEQEPDESARAQMQRAMEYMGVGPGDSIKGLDVQQVFIGSCTNARIDDLRRASRIVAGKRVADTVRAIVVPGSRNIKQLAEQEGLDRIFLDAGMEWHEAGCSMCAAINGDLVAPDTRCVSTSNRNFEGRQGLRARSHLVSPEIAAACAVSGKISNPWEV
ncbi:3-isopropylmalate dehydratase large subunit [Pacificibacter marinus]|uniref:3-isopropylmalate dehydratase large subunit n=1 Tax=Pacificibacter marinus TaxID=658057 RepID=UPI001C07931C|nr:3-isopropylmalate dehydratase large subunit [Pacificibacter marinus]MBU2867459.1 3-isopropylmalate dehydratase large subunit [Pacificibacter marinus]